MVYWYVVSVTSEDEFDLCLGSFCCGVAPSAAAKPHWDVFLSAWTLQEVPASGSAQFEIQRGKKEPEMDLFLLMRILKVA